MKSLQKQITISISALLLLCFSVTVLPLDLFHDHSFETRSGCQDLVTLKRCEHKYHISQKAKTCWLCAIHYDKNFIRESEIGNASLIPAFALFYQNEVKAYFIKLIFSSLRGPPTK